MALEILKTFTPLITTVKTEMERQEAVVQALKDIVTTTANAISKEQPTTKQTEIDVRLVVSMRHSHFTLINDMDDTSIVPLIRAELTQVASTVSLAEHVR